MHAHLGCDEVARGSGCVPPIFAVVPSLCGGPVHGWAVLGAVGADRAAGLARVAVSVIVAGLPPGISGRRV